MKIFIRFLGGRAWSEHTSFKESDDTLFFVEVFGFLWAKQRHVYSMPLAVGVSLFGLKPIDCCTRSLFDQDDTRQHLNQAVDELNDSFGKNAVYLGGAHHALHAAPDKIAFTHIPETSEQVQNKAVSSMKMTRSQTAENKKSPKRQPSLRLFW
jgi:DNA polymerase-4